MCCNVYLRPLVRVRGWISGGSFILGLARVVGLLDIQGFRLPVDIHVGIVVAVTVLEQRVECHETAIGVLDPIIRYRTWGHLREAERRAGEGDGGMTETDPVIKKGDRRSGRGETGGRGFFLKRWYNILH